MSICLGCARRGFCGIVEAFAPELDGSELECRLLEAGVIEGALIRVEHEAPFGRDPVVLWIDDHRVAMHRADVMGVLMSPQGFTGNGNRATRSA